MDGRSETILISEHVNFCTCAYTNKLTMKKGHKHSYTDSVIQWISCDHGTFIVPVTLVCFECFHFQLFLQPKIHSNLLFLWFIIFYLCASQPPALYHLKQFKRSWRQLKIDFSTHWNTLLLVWRKRFSRKVMCCSTTTLTWALDFLPYGSQSRIEPSSLSRWYSLNGIGVNPKLSETWISEIWLFLSKTPVSICSQYYVHEKILKLCTV